MADGTFDALTVNNGATISGNTSVVSRNGGTSAILRRLDGTAGAYAVAQIDRTGAIYGYIGGDASDNLTILRGADGAVALTINRTTGVVTLEAGLVVKAPTLSPITTTQRDALTPSDGMIVYNSTEKRFDGYSNGAWRALAPNPTVPNACATMTTNKLIPGDGAYYKVTGFTSNWDATQSGVQILDLANDGFKPRAYGNGGFPKGLYLIHLKTLWIANGSWTASTIVEMGFGSASTAIDTASQVISNPLSGNYSGVILDATYVSPFNGTTDELYLWALQDSGVDAYIDTAMVEITKLSANQGAVA